MAETDPEDTMSRPLTKEDYLLIGGVIFVIISCLIALVRAYPVNVRPVRRRSSADLLSAGQDFSQMHGPYRRSDAGERSLNLHQATGIDRHHGAGAGAQD